MDSVVEAVDSVAGGPHVLVAVRGAHPLWDMTVDRLRATGRRVTHEVLDEHARGWNPLSLYRAHPHSDVLVHHDPFVPETGAAGSPSDMVRDLLALGCSPVFVDFPSGLRDTALQRRLRSAYLAALEPSPTALRESADAVANVIGRARALDVVSDAGVLRISRPWQLRDDWSSAACDGPVRQLPGAEVWLACEPERVDGVLSTAAGREPAVLTVRAGRIRGGPPAFAAEPIVELGIGVNPRAAWLPGTSLAEKAAGRLHVGFGDNALLGGSRTAPVHFDIPLSKDSRAWAVMEDDRRVRVDLLRHS
ncbi:hypothetical protein [Streptomyces sp. CL12]|uniref:hypothetical protein n=1 Tax=Streptomyces sp. CL12 TaxID=3391744 RepID=UPI003A7F789B